MNKKRKGIVCLYVDIRIYVGSLYAYSFCTVKAIFQTNFHSRSLPDSLSEIDL